MADKSAQKVCVFAKYSPYQPISYSGINARPVLSTDTDNGVLPHTYV